MHFTASSLALSLGLASTALALPHSNPHFARQAASRPVFIGATDLDGDGSRANVSGPLDVCVPIPAARANTFESIQTQEDISCVFFDNADCTGATEVTFIPAGLRGTNFFQDLTVLKQKSESWICSLLVAGVPVQPSAPAPALPVVTTPPGGTNIRPVFTATDDLNGDGSRFNVMGELTTCVAIVPARQNLFVSIQTAEDLQCVFFANIDCTGASELTFIPDANKGQNFFQNLVILPKKSESWICSPVGTGATPISVGARPPTFTTAPGPVVVTTPAPVGTIRPVFDATDDSNGGGNRFNVQGPLGSCVNIAVPRQNRFISIEVADDLQCVFFQDDNCNGLSELTFKPRNLVGQDVFSPFGVISGQSNSWLCSVLNPVRTTIQPLFTAALQINGSGTTRPVSQIVDQCFNFPAPFQNDIESISIADGFMCAFWDGLGCAGNMEVVTPTGFKNLGSVLAGKSESWKCLPLPAQ